MLDRSELESFLKKGNLLGLVGFQHDIRASNNIHIQESISRKSTINVNDLASETPFIDTEVTDEIQPTLEITNKFDINHIEKKPLKKELW